MNRINKYCVLAIGFIASLLLLYSCVEPFSPPEVNSDAKYLVIDGFLNMGSDTSRINLSHTQSSTATEAVLNEVGAIITAEEEKGQTYNFVEEGNGSYYLPHQNFNVTGKYRLHIKTANGKEYVSDYVEVKSTPPIDSVAYKYDSRQEGGVMYVNTHDPKNLTRFYRWKFEETWEYRSAFYSGLEVVNKQIISRRENVNTCWRTIKSGNILLGSTIKLSQDIIKDLPLTVVPVSTNKLYIKYSILVKQYGLTQDAFEYWTSLAKTTEGTGSLFDPLPSQVTGNFKCVTDSKELVFGYFSASVEQTKRIFISPGLGAYPTCARPDTLTISEAMNSTPGEVLLNFTGTRPDSVLYSNAACADCRAQGGTTTKPSFWQ
ncbi:DUF4249 domain-containing protein [Dyadobacter subterraneus]|uniref:DUF4249 domain-containing protein n=1 Tax=Dyadobacter subterraneus TaxID=2773304 RepID=A0ABR9WIF4_9BACT|nr:DUF4249 domain-containing protein [Dyadobacter subterraneus]MBE9465298.1 DUF4249 domain-containing protein [Dyadobacter subterraneus]